MIRLTPTLQANSVSDDSLPEGPLLWPVAWGSRSQEPFFKNTLPVIVWTLRREYHEVRSFMKFLLNPK